MKTGSICVLLLLWTVPAIAQTDHLATVQRFRATYPAVMSEAQKAELLNRVAWEHRTEGWGLLRKTGGARCPAPQGVEVACDILVYAPTAWHFDVLVDGQIPAWQDAGPCDPAVSGCDMSRFLAPVRPPGATGGPGRRGRRRQGGNQRVSAGDRHLVRARLVDAIRELNQRSMGTFRGYSRDCGFRRRWQDRLDRLPTSERRMVYPILFTRL